jgi:hypothetical protein
MYELHARQLLTSYRYDLYDVDHAMDIVAAQQSMIAQWIAKQGNGTKGTHY